MESSHLGVDSVLPVFVTGHGRPDLQHAACGRQRADVQLEELLGAVVVGQSREVHPGGAAPSTEKASPAGCTLTATHELSNNS